MMNETISGNKALPVQPENRLMELDVLRGFAMFGILLANMLFFSFPYMHASLTGTKHWAAWIDKAAAGFIRIAAEGHFITMLSFLFGVGFVLFLERAQAKGKKAGGLYVRRMLVLLAFGLVHAIFLWSGDILVFYAIAGLVLLLFRHAKPQGLLLGALLFFLIPILLMTMLFGLFALVPPADDPLMDLQMTLWLEEERQLMEAYAHGSYGDIFDARKIELSLVYTSSIITSLPFIIGMFLLGAYAGRKGVFQQLASHGGLVRKVWVWSLVIGVPFSIIKHIGLYHMDPSQMSFYDFYHFLGLYVGDPAICFLFIASILLLIRKQIWQRGFRLLANAGRMALTLYLMQTVLATTIFYGYGLGLYGTPPRWLPLWAIGIFAFQLWFSHLWFRKFRFGPMETVWRFLTYGRLSARPSAEEKQLSG
ncbi:DUF418 domain-containing protein [Xylanibacillus composti]|uniref:DUF418 domain-containing protein n=1 Tax=Xylanibacillus composti TaxID=1572762 RepID=A0A8J4H3F1_9BACL|nr:DUF418 domain-containing protein [Xylanibacillus composti]MDT9726039.1 DUF418 domain-containing protein [Xylanibacillus composti]GIQ68816.1 hypothetical protein XYCOK13_16400 [Xylanibacillus composti]